MITEETRKSAKLRNILILIARCLALLCLVLAFAIPFRKKDNPLVQNTPSAFSIFIDNSFSMAQEFNKLSQLDIAKSKSKSIIESAPEQARFHILSHEFGSNENKFVSKKEALELVGGLKISSKTRSTQSITEKQKLLLQSEQVPNKLAFVLSDFQKSHTQPEQWTKDTTPRYLLPIPARQKQNIYIDTAWIETPSLMQQVEATIVAKIVNTGESAANTTLTLAANKQLKSLSSIELKPNEVSYQKINYTPSAAGNQQLALYINDYPVSFDDTFFIAARINAGQSILILNQQNSNSFLNNVFKPIRNTKVDNHLIHQVNPTLFANYSLIILNGTTQITEPTRTALDNYLRRGGNILIFPSNTGSQRELQTLTSMWSQVEWGTIDTQSIQVSTFNKSHHLFKDLFEKIPENIQLPTTFKRYKLQQNSLSNFQKLFSFSNGETFLGVSRVDNGQVYICTSSPEASWSDFPKSYWFLPLLYKMALSESNSKILAFTLGQNNTILVENQKMNDKTIYHFYGNGIDAIPQQKAVGNKIQLRLHNGIHQAGIYGIALPGSSDTLYAGINYNRLESAVDYYSSEELKQLVKSDNVHIVDNDPNVQSQWQVGEASFPLWKVFIILALLFLLTEIALIRLMK